MQLETDLTNDLHEWGKWANACPSRSLNYPRCEPFSIKKGGLGISITEDWALELDQAIALLFNNDKQITKLFKLYFVCGFSLRDIEKTSGIKRTNAQRMIENSVMWLNGYFCSKQNVA